MKKLLTFAAVAAFAVSSFGASVSWFSGPLTNPKNAAGETGGGAIGASAGFMQVWFFESLEDANAFAASDYSDMSGVFHGADGIENDTVKSLAGFGSYTAITSDAFAGGTEYFTIAYVETTISGNETEDLNNTWYMYSDVGSFTTPETGNSNINFTTTTSDLGAQRHWPNNWTPVPEPATGALALAGAALLLRRRRRA